MNNKKRYLIGSLVIVAALVALVASSMQSNTLRSIPVKELRAADTTPQSLVGQRLRVVGFVGREPVQKSPRQTAHGVVNVQRFSVVEDGVTLAVEYHDALPDNFRPGGPVQIDGEYAAPGKLKAEHIYTKCPSKYDTLKPGDKQEYSKDGKQAAGDRPGVLPASLGAGS